MRWTWMAVLVLAAGCGGIELEQLLKQHAARTRVMPEPPGAHCPHGGQAVQSGLDLDDDGALDDAEVTSTEYACATVLTFMREEQAGAHCEHGGQAVQSGLDVDASGTLEAAEVTGTEYVCATPVPGLLVRTRQVPPGERCPDGGQVSHAGNDTNGDGVLDDGEITREVYGCTETAPVLVRLTTIPPLAGFCNSEGTEVEAGPDVDRDGVLDAGEVQAYTRLCMNTLAVRARQRPEPAGTQCTVAGTAVLVGADSNGDGTLGEDEAHEKLYVCEPARTFDGTYEVAGAEDLVVLQGITRIRGGLFIRGTALQEVVLPGLVTVEGRLSIMSNPDLLRASLTSLRYVGEQLDVSDNPVLETLELGGARERRLSVETDLEVTSNPRLLSLSGLRFVAPTRNLTVSGNAALESLEGLDQVTVLTGSFTLSANVSLPRIVLPKLEAIGAVLHISDNDSLTALGDLSGLRTVGEDVVITNNDALVDLSGMPILQVVGESLRVHGNDGLLSTEGLGHLRRLRHLAFFDNARLETAGHLPSLESIDYGLVIQGNPKLVSLSNLPMLTHVGSFVSISENPLLTQVQGLGRLLRLKQLTVANNAALTSLSGLAGLRELEDLTVRENAELLRLDLDGLATVSTRFTVAYNPKLPRCLAASLAESAHKGSSDDFLVEGNDDVTTCGP